MARTSNRGARNRTTLADILVRAGYDHGKVLQAVDFPQVETLSFSSIENGDDVRLVVDPKYIQIRSGGQWIGDRTEILASNLLPITVDSINRQLVRDQTIPATYRDTSGRDVWKVRASPVMTRHEVTTTSSGDLELSFGLVTLGAAIEGTATAHPDGTLTYDTGTWNWTGTITSQAGDTFLAFGPGSNVVRLYLGWLGVTAKWLATGTAPTIENSIFEIVYSQFTDFYSQTDSIRLEDYSPFVQKVTANGRTATQYTSSSSGTPSQLPEILTNLTLFEGDDGKHFFHPLPPREWGFPRTLTPPPPLHG